MEPTSTMEDTTPLFSVSMDIPYDVRFMDAVLVWMSGNSVLAGCAQNESAALRLAIEETLTFLINAYPEAETWEQIRIEYVLLPKGLTQITIANAGPPVHLSRIPLYNPQNPSESEIDGLWYCLARNVVDNLTFKNLGWAGWQAVIQKRLAHASFKPLHADKQDTRSDQKPSFTTRIATPNDAAELVDLTYDTYRYSYPAEHFYHEPKLRQVIEERGILSIVVEADGVIIGNSSFVLSQHTPRCAYLCSLMIKRAFRQSRAIIHLLNEVDRFITASSMDVDLCHAGMVTTHTGSQKAGTKLGFMPVAILLSLTPIVDFRGMTTASVDRESLLLVIRLTATPIIPVLYIPERHHAVMDQLIAQSGLNCSISGEQEAPLAMHSAFTSKEELNDGSAFITMTQLGQDLSVRLQKRIFMLKAKGIQTIVILIPAWRPIPPDLDLVMASMHAIFTGIKPVSAQECYLVYCAVSGPVDFSLIKLSDPLAEALKNHCEELFQELVAEKPE